MLEWADLREQHEHGPERREGSSSGDASPEQRPGAAPSGPDAEEEEDEDEEESTERRLGEGMDWKEDGIRYLSQVDGGAPEWRPQISPQLHED